MDINLNVVGSLAQRTIRWTTYDCNVTLTEDIDSSLHGADFVFLQIRVGGLAPHESWTKIYH